MPKPIEIAAKALKVIDSCTNLDHVLMLNKYVDLANKQILKKNCIQNCILATAIQRAAHYKVMDLIKLKELGFDERR
jgi:hypothetical protein